MATNSMYSNDTNESVAGSQSMDAEEESFVSKECQEQLVEHYLLGPVTLFSCIHFIMMSTIIASVNNHIGVYLEEIFQMILSHDTILDNVMIQLQEFVNKFNLNLYTYIIDENGMEFRNLYTTTVRESGKPSCAFLVYNKRNQNFYSFYVRDKDNKSHTTFSMDDTYTLQLFKNLVQYYKWPSDEEVIQQSFDQNILIADQQNNKEENLSTINVNRHIVTVNTDNPSENIINASAVFNLLGQNVQNLFICIGPQLDTLNFLFKSSEYQLHGNDLSSLEDTCDALKVQLKISMKLTDLAAESLKTNRKTQSSIDITETTTIVRDTLLNNHEQEVLPGIQSEFDPTIPFKPLSSTLTSTDRPPITTDNSSETIQLPKLEIDNQPTRLRRHRNLHELRDNVCPAVQVEGAGQGTPLQFKFPNEINHFKQEFYLGAHAVTYDEKEHDQRLVVPIYTSVGKGCNLKTNDLNFLIVPNNGNNDDEFDLKTKGVFSKINPDELKNLRKQWTFKMVNLYQIEPINKILIENKKLKWCRLMFAIYVKLSNGQFKRVSPPIFSDLIKETNGAQTININTVFPDRLCSRGGQMIFVPLVELEEKNNLRVRCNDEDLNQNKFQISGKILSFESPVCIQGRDSLHVIIDKQDDKNDWISLQDFTRPYHPHDEHLDPCGVINSF